MTQVFKDKHTEGVQRLTGFCAGCISLLLCEPRARALLRLPVQVCSLNVH
jgi:hypothetical protein